MAFQIKDFASVAASMVNWMKATTKKITDFNVGSVARTLVEAAAIEIDELYQRMFIGLKEAIPVSVYNSFDFGRQPAIPASGKVSITMNAQASNTLIPAGTTFTAVGPGTQFVSSMDMIVVAGATTAEILVVASAAGASGNVTVGTNFELSPTVPGLLTAKNLMPFTNGADLESDDQRKIRFVAYIATLQRGIVAALEYGLKTAVLRDPVGNEIERVRFVQVYEPWIYDSNQPIAYVKCYVHNGVGATSTALQYRAATILYGYTNDDGTKVPGYRAAGVNVETLIATEVLVDVTGQLTTRAGYVQSDVVQKAHEAIYSYLQGLNINENALKAEIYAVVMAVDGVYNFIPSTPAADVPPVHTPSGQSVGVKLMPGTIILTV